MDPPPSFKAEIYYLVAKFLENGPCQNAANALRQDLESHELVPVRYDWKGESHRKTFRDMEDEFGQVPNEFLLRKCFELCTRLNPGTSSVRSLLRKEIRASNLLNANYFQRLHNNQIGLNKIYDYQLKWHAQLATNMKLLRRTFGHLSSVYCLIFDRSGRLIVTGADDMLVKCWSFIDGRLIHTFRGASSEISDLAISHDNKLLAAGSCDKVIRVWELHTASPVAVLTKHTSTITAINFCPYLLNPDGGRYLASTSGDGTVSFWRYKYSQHGHTEFDELPTRYHEKIRPGSTQMICASFSPGGVFFCVGSADHNVRVYKMNGADGPVRILEEELHEDRVDSIQWCNTPNELRFLSGSKDGTARIWTFSHRRWTTLVLNMKTGDNRDPSLQRNNQQPPAPRQQAVSRSGRQINTEASNNSDSNQTGSDANQVISNNKKMKSVTMVSWSLDDSLAITAVSDLTLKIWDSHKGTLLFNLTGHEDEIFVLEPHPYASNLLLTAAHDGHIIIWDLETRAQVFKHRNLIEEQGNTQGHGPVFDAKWSKDGTTICASDSHGHILFVSHGSSERYNKCPTELFFHTDYRPLLRDSFHNVVDEQTQLPPHLLPPPFLVDSEGDPYPAYVQRLVRGRENMSERDALVPIGPEPSFQAPHQHMEEDLEDQNNDEPQNENPEERLNRFRNEMLRNLPNRGDQPNNQRNETDEANENGEEENNVTNAVRANKLVILNEKTNYQEIQETIERAKACSVLESALFTTESNKDGFMDHDYSTRPSVSSKTKQKSRKEPRNRQSNARNQPEEEEEEEEAPNQNENNDETTDCSLDESDFSSAESTTGASSEHSDWGSDNSASKQPEPNVAVKKKSSPKEKKRRSAAQKCRERMLLPDGPISDEFVPSPWLSEAFPRKTPYFPQIGDVLMYFKSGHEKYIELVEARKAYKLNMREQQWRKKKNLDEATMVKVIDINFEIRPPRLCVLKLSILSQSTSKPTGENLIIKYHDMNDVVDFLVLYQAFNSHKGKHWKKGDRIRCQIDDRWWKGTVQKAESNRDSPFLSIFVHWDNNDKEYLSPWDLESLDNDTMEITDGEAVSVEQLKKSLYIPTSEEWNSIGRESECTRISEALASIMELAIAEPFNLPVDLTQYPDYMLDVEYPMDLSLIKARVENHFYRRIDAIKHDVKYIYSNAASFNRPKSDIVRNAKIIQNLALEIVGDTAKTKDDVSAIYHRLVESFEWSEEEEEEEDSENSDNDDGAHDDERAVRNRKRSKKKNVSPNLNPKKWKHDCNELLTEMSALPFSVPFREPVSEIDFPDYHRFVATPMDLSTVRESLHIGDYNSPLDFQKDIKLIFKNSKEYNTNPKSKVLSMTIKLEEWFESRIGSLISDWRNTMRRLTIAKRKHKAKKQQDLQSPGYSGKGKGKGKGQSNKIKKKKDSSEDEDNDSEPDDDDDDDDEDFINPKPGPSKAVQKPQKSTAAPPLRNAMTEANAGRRTSSRQSKLPLRFQEESAGADDSDEECKPLRKASSTASASSKKAKTEPNEDDEEKPLSRRRKTPDQPSTSKVKQEDEEDEPLVKRSNPSKKKVIDNSSDEDIPLAVIKKSSGSKVNSPEKRAPSRHSSRPPKPSRRYKDSESEDEQRIASRRTSKTRAKSGSGKRSRRPASSSTSPKRKSRKESKRRAAKRARYDDGGSESESESEESSEESSESDDGGFSNVRPRRQQPRAGPSRMQAARSRGRNVAHDDDGEESEEEILPQRKRRQIVARSNRIRMASTSSTSNSLPSRRNVKRPANYVESEDEPPQRSRPSRNGSKAKSSSSSRRRKKAYEEDSFTEETSDDDDDEEEEDSEDSDTSSREKAHLKKKSKKTTVTSRGRISKPNPRIS